MVCHLLGSAQLNFDRYLTNFTFKLFKLSNFSSNQLNSCRNDSALSQSSLISCTFNIFIAQQPTVGQVKVRVKFTLVQVMKTQRGSRRIAVFSFNLLAPELFFLILAHPVYNMWITQEPNKLELWNKLHFEERERESKKGEYTPRLKYSVPIFVE